MSDIKHQGEVCWFDPRKGMGFISWSLNGVPQKDMFVHFSDIVAQGFKTLLKDQKVSFSIGTNKRGEPKATEVTVLQ